jgi:hypothetical protein
MNDVAVVPALVQVFAGATIAMAGVRFAGANCPKSSLIEHSSAVSLIMIGAFVMWATVRSLSPVAVDVSYEVVARSQGTVTLSLYGTKARPECHLLGGEAYVHIAGDGVGMRKAGMQWPRDPRPGSSRPSGLQSFGEWEVTFQEPPEPYAASLQLHHDCGRWLGLTHTELGPFPIPRAGSVSGARPAPRAP